MSKVECKLDRNVVNAKTFPDMTNAGLSFFAPLCGNNRGAFVLDPPDGNTYGCNSFPHAFPQLAGIVDTEVSTENGNSIFSLYNSGEITAGDAVDMLDLFVRSVYRSSSGVDDDPMACNTEGLSELTCGETTAGLPETSGNTTRAVTLSGLFVPALWATGGKELTPEEASNFYTSKDFSEMKELGLNAVQIPVPLSIFAARNRSTINPLGNVLKMVDDAGLAAILLLVDTGDDPVLVTTAAKYASKLGTNIALILPSGNAISYARAASSTMTLLVPTDLKSLPTLQKVDPYIFAALNLSHTETVADVASSTSSDDRVKMYYHESVSCTMRSPIEFSLCQRGVPAFVTNGFDLAVDNCIFQDMSYFLDYGQCDRFNETVDSRWWHAHRASFAARQIAAYEQGLGWSFAAWKLYNQTDDSAIDSPAKLLTLKAVVAAGLMPSLTGSMPAVLACLNPPENDMILGDATLAPIPAPPPACEGGWWSPEKGMCDYWVPPPPTPAPTPCLTNADLQIHQSNAGIKGFLGGILATFVAGAVAFLAINRRTNIGRYSRIPDSSVP